MGSVRRQHLLRGNSEGTAERKRKKNHHAPLAVMLRGAIQQLVGRERCIDHIHSLIFLWNYTLWTNWMDDMAALKEDVLISYQLSLAILELIARPNVQLVLRQARRT